MKKILISLLLSLSILYGQSIGKYSLRVKSNTSNYTVYFNGFPCKINSSSGLIGMVKQGENQIVLVSRQDISKLSIRIKSNASMKKYGIRYKTNLTISLTNGIERVIKINLENYGFNNPWENAEEFSSLPNSDKTIISNTINSYLDIYENEKMGQEFDTFSSNTLKYVTEMDMASKDITFYESIESDRNWITNNYTGDNRKSFSKWQDYNISISPYNNKIIIVKSKTNPLLLHIESKTSDDMFNVDVKDYFLTFFKKDGQWWMY